MTVDNQKVTAKENNKNTQPSRQEMTPQEHALAQPEGRKRAKPGTTGEGDYYHIIVRPKSEFVTFRNQDVGDPGHILRMAGKRSNGSWDTHAWLINKQDALVEGKTLIANTEDSKKLLESLGSKPALVKGDIYEAKDKPNVPERLKPTESQQKAWMENIKKAQLARKAKAGKKA